MSAITVAIRTKTVESQKNSSALENISSSLRQREMPCSYGVNSSMHRDKMESIAQYLETNHGILHRTLSERLTPSLILSGLVIGTTLTFGARLLNRGIPAGVLYAPDGRSVDLPRKAFLF